MCGAIVNESRSSKFRIGQKVKIIEPSPFQGKRGEVKEVRWTRGEFMYKVHLTSGWNYPFYESCLERIS